MRMEWAEVSRLALYLDSDFFQSINDKHFLPSREGLE